ncbi:MAG TPA: AI-2E family transporter [Longimicrobiaceae bacterium]|nr:AI-2E family transporter [Longimicrobiaceae bacterium]
MTPDPQNEQPALDPRDHPDLQPDLSAHPEPHSNAPGEPPPSTEKLTDTVTGPRARSFGVTIVAVLAVFYALRVGREFFMPVAFALLLNLLFSPLIRSLKRFRIPPPVSAGAVLLAIMGMLALGAYELSDPVQEWVTKGPRSVQTTAARLRKIRRPVDQVTRAAEQVDRATSVPTSPRTQQVVVQGPTVAERLFGTTQALAVFAMEVLILLYFLLAAGDLFLQKLVGVLPNLDDKKKAVRMAREMEGSVSAYLVTLTMLNTGLGTAVALLMWGLGVPNPVLWGVLAGLMEFIPYLGAGTMLIVLSIAGLSTFEAPAQALLVPGGYLAINFVQANFVSPAVLGRRLTLNPVAILIGLALWYEMWGVPGVFIAVPLLAAFKICCDHIETLAPIGEFLSR